MEKIIEKAKKIVNIDYVEDTDDLIYLIELLVDEVEHWKEEYKNLEQNLQDNYRPLTPSEMGWE